MAKVNKIHIGQKRRVAINKIPIRKDVNNYST